MKVTFERSGGFIGISQRLEVDGDSVRISDRRSRLERQRPLTQEEQARLSAAVKAVEGVPPPEGERGIADGFALRIELPGQQVSLDTLAVPYGEGDGSPWGTLLALLDGLLEGSLGAKPRRPDLIDDALLK